MCIRDSGDTVEGLFTDKDLKTPAFTDDTLFVYEWPHISLYDWSWTEKPVKAASADDDFIGEVVAE